MSIDLLLRNGHIITMDSKRRILANASVAINVAEIVDIRDSNEKKEGYKGRTHRK